MSPKGVKKLAKPRTLTLEQRVNKKIYDSLSDLSAEVIDLIKTAGDRTGRQQLTHDLVECEAGIKIVSFGPVYFADFREKYKRKSETFEELAPLQPIACINKELEVALTEADRPGGDRKKLLGVLTVFGPMNETIRRLLPHDYAPQTQ